VTVIVTKTASRPPHHGAPTPTNPLTQGPGPEQDLGMLVSDVRASLELRDDVWMDE
jgi:hypothetical protein